MSDFLNVVKKRRSVYGLNAESPLPDDQLAALLRETIMALPTAYNMQSTRMVLLLGDAHKRLWEIVLEVLRERATSEERFAKTKQKIGTFAAGHGSVLFFDDSEVTARFKAENPAYAANFDSWYLQQNGMLQVTVWNLLAEQGLGASLQHYNPIIDDKVKAEWDLPASWELLAQMPFGEVTAAPGPKEKEPPEVRFRVIGG